MAEEISGARSAFLDDTRSVLDAARRLERGLDDPPERVRRSVRRLEDEADRQDAGSTTLGFMFASSEGTSQEPDPWATTDGALGLLLVESRVANVLMAAGRATGESEEPADRRLLEEAVRDLERDSALVGSEEADPLAAGPGGAEFGFGGAVASGLAGPSADLEGAQRAFREQAAQMLDVLVDEAASVARKLVDTLTGFLPDKVKEGFSILEQLSGDAEAAGGLIGRGLRKLAKVAAWLASLFPSAARSAVKERAEAVWSGLRSGDALGATFAWAFQTADARSEVEVRASGARAIERLDDASAALVALGARYRSTMGRARGLAGALAVAIGITGVLSVVVGVVVPYSLPLGLSAALLLFAGVVLIGMDYADAGGVPSRVEGVRAIARGVEG